VILNDSGEADIYLNGTYTIVLTDADDVTQWTLNGVQGAPVEDVVVSIVATLASIASGTTDGELVIDAGTGNSYTWDNDNSKWRIVPGNIYTTAQLAAIIAATYTIETGTLIIDSTLSKMKIWDGSQWSIREAEWVPVEWGKDGASAPAVADDTTASNMTVVSRGFDNSADEDLVFPLRVPEVHTGKVLFRVHTIVTEATAFTAKGFAFALQGFSIGSGDPLGGTPGTAVVVTIDGETHAQNDIIISAWSSEVTITDLASGELAMFKVYRDVSDADDDYGADIGLIGIDIMWQ